MSEGDRGTAIEVQKLTRRFGPSLAVDGLSFRVDGGELFGLVGPDGAGKTTTLRMLAGVLRPSAGDARVDGVSVVADPERVKRAIAYMPQRFGLYADLTVAENLDFFADLFEVASADRPARLERLYAFSNLAPFKNRLAGKLSGGMKQKLGLSCALIHEPRILLLDEPTFGVDPVSRRDLWLIVHEMVGKGVTVVVSTAYMDEAERFDRVALLDRGRVIAIDTPLALKDGLSGTIVAVRTADPRRGRAAALGHRAVRRATVFGDWIHLTMAPEEEDPVSSARYALEEAGFGVDEAERLTPSMEDVFIDRIAASTGDR